MYKIERLKSYFVCFFLFGLSSYIPSKRFNQKKQIHYTILKQLPRAVHVVFVVLYFCQTYWNSNIVTVSSVEYISTMSICGMQLAVLIDDIAFERKIERMLLNLFESIDFLEKSMKLPVCLKSFEQNLRWKLFLCNIMNIFFLYIKLMTKSPKISNISFIWYFILVVYRTIALFQVLFFIDLSNVILSHINQELQHLCSEFIVFPIKSNGNNKFVNTMRQIKVIHFKLCRVATLINSRFGWFMILSLLHLIAVPCISVFSVYVLLTGPSEWIYRTYRKYLDFYNSCATADTTVAPNKFFMHFSFFRLPN